MSSFRRLLNAGLGRIGYSLERADPKARFSKAQADLVRQLSAQIASSMRYTVEGGLFDGLRLLEATSWSSADLVAKLTGSYEQELRPVIGMAVDATPDCVINVGCADGFYAVALGRLMPDAEIYAFDIDPRAPHEVEQMQALNNVKVHFRTRFDCAEPLPELMAYSRPFFVFDCEGYEQHLPDMPTDLLRRSLFLIETHDLFVPGVTRKLVDFLEDTHTVNVVPAAGRNPHLYPALERLSYIEKYLLLCEFRGCGGNEWIYATPKGTPI